MIGRSLRGKRLFTSSIDQTLKWASSKYDSSQVAQMQDSVTLVDEHDNVLGPISKVEAHLRTNLE